MRRRTTATGRAAAPAGPVRALGLGLALLTWTIRVMTYGPLEGIRLALHSR